MRPRVVWFGRRTSWRIAAAHVAYRRACHYVPTASRRAIIIATISTCSSVKREAHATVAIHLWWRRLGKVYARIASSIYRFCFPTFRSLIEASHFADFVISTGQRLLWINQPHRRISCAWPKRWCPELSFDLYNICAKTGTLSITRIEFPREVQLFSLIVHRLCELTLSYAEAS